MAQDEALATELNDLLQDRLKTFLYSKSQEEIAGKDGEEIFGRVFSEEARVVVVLYRTGWGKTPWTRIEETAIRNRAFEQGYDFTIFIPLDDVPSMPKWVPKNRLWIGLKRWGTNGAAGAIEARVQEHGGEPHEETVIERAARLKRSLEFEEKRREFRYSFEGVRVANLEFDKLNGEIIRLIEEVNRAGSGIELRAANRSDREIMISGLGLWLSVQWKCSGNNSIDDAELRLDLWDGDPSLPDIVRGTTLEKLGEAQFSFDIVPTGEYLWIASSSGRSFSSKVMSSYIVKYYLEKIQETHKS
jgi:hypothetical protein